MKKVMSFTIKNNYINARKIADYIIISLMKHSNPDSRYCATYVSSVSLCKIKHIIFSSIDIDKINDCYVTFYKITIYKVKGNHDSILSPSQNEIYDNIIAVDSLSEIIDKLEK